MTKIGSGPERTAAMKAKRIIGVALTALAVSTVAAPAQDWPTRPVTMVVPFAAGGPIDVVARILTPRMSELLGQQLIVDNVPGAALASEASGQRGNSISARAGHSP
jgi:tripartite-type tricarboxylate transporter receptor subunit TctC